MSLFENLSIQAKAFATSAVLVICLVSLGSVAYVTLDKSQEGLHTLSTTVLPRQHAFAAVKDSIVAVQMKIFRYVSWASNGVNASLLRSLSSEVDTDLLAIQKNMGTLAARADLSEAQKADLRALILKWKHYESSAKDTLEVGSTDAPMATMMLGQADEKFMALAADFQKMSGSVVARTNEISTELVTDAEQKKMVLVIGGGIGLLLSLVISLMVSRSIVKPIRSVTHAMRQLSSGDTEVDVGYRNRRDEIGQMVEAIAVFRRNVLEMRAMEYENLEAEKQRLKEIGAARARLTDAIEAISDGFSLYDADDRLVVFNSKYKTLFAADANFIEVGRPFEAIIRAASLRDMVEDAAGDYEAWVARRIAQHRSASSTHIQHRNDGRYIQINERKTAEGGVVATYADITELKRNEVELARLVKGLQDATADLTESLEQQTATSEVLRVISSSNDNTQPVFDMIARRALQLCDAHFCAVFQFDGELIHLAAHHGLSAEGALAYERGFPLPPTRTTAIGRAILDRSLAEIPDVEADAEYGSLGIARAVTFRAILAVPLMRDGIPIGGIAVSRASVGPFPPKHIDLLHSFADQAVIAIENVRLFRKSKEALEQQTASSEILGVISRSPTDSGPVFEAILEGATRLCDAHLGVLNLYDGENYRTVAQSGGNPDFARWVFERGPFRPAGFMARMIEDRQPVQVADMKDSAEYREGLMHPVHFVDMGGARSYLIVPLIKDETVLGGISIFRPEVRPFSEKQIDLVRTFASQAVIAIENVRLFNEVTAHTEALTRAVDEMRALGEVGQAVSSTLDLDTVLATIITHAVELSQADAGGTIYEFDDAAGVFVPRASHGVSEAMIASLRDSRIRLGETTLGICAEQRAPFQTADVTLMRRDQVRDLLQREGVRALLAVPLLREERVIGGLVIRRKSAGEFSPSVVMLLQTFAAQSVLAIQNAHLFREIAEKGEQLEAASKLKSQFLANMSHELRTPLNAIIGVTEMLHEDAVDLKREDDLEPLERVLRAAKHLLALINDILDLSKIEAGKMDLHIESFAIAPLIEDVVQTIGTMAAKNGNTVVVDCAVALGSMRADQTRIRQALLNLASNANKFTERGTVTIGAKRSIEAGREWVTMAVSDTGIGLTPEQMGKLFQDFVQADASTTRKYGGTGLGLAISRRFCQMMGGDISVSSEPGRGSVFTIRLPANTEEPVSAPASTGLPVITGQGGAPLVLVVDDDLTVREVIGRYLERAGFSVVTADGGQEALRLARELHPAAMTLDIMMPGIDGWTVLAALKGDPELADIPVVLITIVDEKNRGFSLGAAEYLVKPVNREKLTVVLRGIVGGLERRVLLVDDDDFGRKAMCDGLVQNGWEVTEAANGRVALECLAQARPDLIILDLMMPEMDGFEFLAELRQKPEWRDIPVVVVTARDLTDEDRSRLNGGAERIIQKSERDELLDEVRSTLGKCIGRRNGAKGTGS